MLHINKEKLLETREKLLNLLSSKELNDDVQRLVREDLRNLEKELEELGESKKDPQDKG
jgi:predicted component of type VI protein secretion system